VPAVAGQALLFHRIAQFAAHPEQAESAHRVLHAVVSALVRPEDIAVPPQVHAAAVNHAVQFTQAQVGAMAQSYRAAFALALHALDRSALAQRAPTFAALSPAAQDRLLSAWSASPLPQTRQFLRLVRSASLLGFFEYPPVASAILRKAATA
jgi:hypothetical protein